MLVLRSFISIVVESNELSGERFRLGGCVAVCFSLDGGFFVLLLVGIGDCVDVVEVVVVEVLVVGNFDVGSLDALVALVFCFAGFFVVVVCCFCLYRS